VNLDGQNTRPPVDKALFENSGNRNITFKNADVGNVQDRQAMVLGGDDSSTNMNIVIDNVNFHDVVLRTSGTHTECIFSQVPGLVVKNSKFTNCAIMDLFVLRGDWWGQPGYDGLTLLNNDWGTPHNDNGSCCNYYSVYINDVSGTGNLADVEIRNNIFRQEMPGRGTVYGAPTFRGSVESCNTPPTGLDEITVEPCGDPNPDPTPTPTPTVTPTATPTVTPTPTPNPGGVVGRQTSGTTGDFTVANELSGWDFIASNVSVNRICAQTKVANTGITGVDLAIYANGTSKAKLASARFSGNPGTGVFCVPISTTNLDGPVRLAWSPRGARMNWQGTSGVTYSTFCCPAQLSDPWPSGSSNGTNVDPVIYADNTNPSPTPTPTPTETPTPTPTATPTETPTPTPTPTPDCG